MERVARLSLLAFVTLTVLLSRPARSAWPPPVPPQLQMAVRETAGIARTGEVLRSGVPLPRGLNVTSTASLTVVDGGGIPVPADFRILARWNAALTDTMAPIQWVLVAFAATVGANATATYRLVTDGSAGPNPAPGTPLTLTQMGNTVVVNTGVATFTFGTSAGALFDSVVRNGAGTLVTGSAMTARANATDTAHTVTRSVTVEHQGPLSAAVVVDGAYDLPATGGAGLGSKRRYVFTAGSPTAVVRHVVAYEGELCASGVIFCNGAPDGVLVESVRDRLTLALAPPLAVTAVGAFAAAASQGTATAGQTASVRQLLRNVRTDPFSFTGTVPGGAALSGTKADGGVLAVSTGAGAVAVALDHMHRYEPQALRLLADGSLAVDVAGGTAWLGSRQGLYATLAVSVLPSSPTRADLDRLVFAPLDHPLHAWPSPQWFASSEAVDELPVGSLAPELTRYDTLMPAALNLTLSELDAKGLPGLMTYGLFPRTWSDPINTDEIDCGGSDPTPADDWDDAYWCATWTDYHGASATAPIWAMRSGDVTWLDEIAFPAARRVLHTQIFQCAPGDTFFYCGQAPAGYGGYRADFNSSHAYFTNLFLYYWLTGDGTVVTTLQRGASSMRDYLCTRRPAMPCLATDPPDDQFANLTGRVASQWNAVFRLVGLASGDASYLDDYRANLGRAATQYYGEPQSMGTAFGFITFDVVGAPGTYGTDQLWMSALYDTNVLYRLERDTLDAGIGIPAVTPSQIQNAYARALRTYGSTVAPGDGTVTGDWPNGMFFTFSGSRIGGTLTSVTPDLGGSDPLLYDTGKAALCAAMVRAADRTGSAPLLQMGRDLVTYTLNVVENRSLPLGKSHAEYFSRLHAAVARLNEDLSCAPDTTGPAITAPAAVTLTQTICQ
ncbi:MAG TPA: hypothetical protein VGR00_10275 [Thermoanaerobaculia bacterium]|nr:hypothetical protein [Thermoanaerobaculia bacterium]